MMRESIQMKKFLLYMVLTVVLVAYFALPPYDKIAQIGYCINNIRFMIKSNEIDEYVFHRNNAIYLTRMDNSKAAINEIDKAIATLPNSASDRILYELYKDRANIKLFYGDYKGALTDYLRVPSHNMMEYLKIAMLLKELGKKQRAVSYCNKIIDLDIKAYAGYACIADIYGSAGKYDASIMIYDLLIDRVPNKARYYADRAMYKQKAGDMQGYESDLKTAKDLSPVLDMKSSITYDAIHPKKLMLSTT